MKHGLGFHFRPLIISTVIALAASVSCISAAAAGWFPHELPVVYRSRRYHADVAKTTVTCIEALKRDGFDIILADDVAGIICTSAKVVAPESPEIGGEWLLTCYVEVRALNDESLVTAELLAERGGVGVYVPIEFDLQRSRRLYDDFFRSVRAVLEAEPE